MKVAMWRLMSHLHTAVILIRSEKAVAHSTDLDKVWGGCLPLGRNQSQVDFVMWQIRIQRHPTG